VLDTLWLRFVRSHAAIPPRVLFTPAAPRGLADEPETFLSLFGANPDPPLLVLLLFFPSVMLGWIVLAPLLMINRDFQSPVCPGPLRTSLFVGPTLPPEEAAGTALTLLPIRSLAIRMTPSAVPHSAYVWKAGKTLRGVFWSDQPVWLPWFLVFLDLSFYDRL